MNEYTASNGVKVINYGGNWDQTTMHFESDRGVDPGVRDVLLEDCDLEALREYLRAKDDERLRRWRWPENPDYVVYAWTADPPRKVRGVTVLSEAIPRGYTVWEDNVDTLHGTSENEEARVQARKAARAYFDAHPERKPWHDAKPGDVWLLKFAGFEYAEASPWTVRGGAGFGGSPEFVYPQNGNTFALNDAEITAGRRIWPTEEEA